MTGPRIAIVTPSYNQAPFLEACLSSVLTQNYPELDYRVLDAGSTDGSLEVIRRHGDRLTAWRSGPDDGHYAAINEGFAESDAEILGWINSDDMLLPGALQYVAEVFSTFPDLTWLTTLAQAKLNGSGDLGVQLLGGLSRDGWLDGRHAGQRRPLWDHNFLQQESTFFRRSIWTAVGGVRTEYSLAGDFDLWSRFFERSEVAVTRRMLGAFRMHGNNRSMNFSVYCKQAAKSLAETRERLNWTPRVLRTHMPKISRFVGHRFTQRLPSQILYQATEVTRVGHAKGAPLTLQRWKYL